MSSYLIRRNRSRRGAAMVEFAVLMLAFVPLILLPMYFADAMRFQLDAQEAVASTVWDFAFADYSSDQSAVNMTPSFTGANQEIYANLWPANKKPKAEKAGPWCDFAWTQELNCQVAKDFGSGAYTTLLINLAQAFHDEYTKGGLVTCTGRIAVENHYIPRQFAQDFANQELFPQGTDALELPEERFAILVDTWAIHDPADSQKCGEGNDPFYERAEFVWTQPITYQFFRGMWLLFVVKMLSDVSVTAFLWDDPTKLKMSSLHYDPGATNDIKKRSVDVSGGRSSFYTNPFGDDDPVKEFKETFEARDSFYMGCTSFGPDCN